MSGGVIKAGKFEVWQECDANTLICTWVQKSETTWENVSSLIFLKYFLFNTKYINHKKKKLKNVYEFISLVKLFFLFIQIYLVTFYLNFYIIKLYLINYLIILFILYYFLNK